MVRWMTCWGALAVLAATALPCSSWACSLCDPSMRSQNTLREELQDAKAVLYGTLANPRLIKKVGVPPGTGTTELHVLRVLRDDLARGGRKTIEIANYLPVPDPANPPKFLAFCSVKDGQLSVYHGRFAKSEAILAYLAGIQEVQSKDRKQQLLFFFKYLDHEDAMVSQDAFLEFARCSDVEIANIGKDLPSAGLRALLRNPKTPPERLGLYAFLLGASGNDKEAAALLKGMVEHTSERTGAALDGALTGYIHLQPREGWDLAAKILADAKKPLNQRIAAIRTLRFYHAWKPAEYQKEILHCLAIVIADGEIADFGIDDLRQWKMWDLTKQVLAQYGKATHNSPMAKHCIIRYALCCPDAEAKQFITTMRQRDPELVRDLEESLDFEKAK